jgi:CheY-like chemotaxis protein
MGEKRLLVCDDEAAVCRFVRNATEHRGGYEVRLTTSGAELMQIYDDFKPTIILLDMVMPGVDGNEVIMWLAGRGCTARLIVMTGYHSQYADHARTLAEYRGFGAVAILHKPFGVKDLLAALEAT